MAVDDSPKAARRAGSGRKHEVPASIMAPRLLLIGSVAVLIVFGLVMVYSASSIEAYTSYGDSAYFLKRQCILLVAGLAIGGFFMIFPYDRWRGRPAWLFWIVIVGLLVITTLFGYVGLGSKRWLYIGSQGFQPSEFAKVAMLVLAADLLILQREGAFPGSFRRFILVMFIVVGVPSAIIFLQPDLGTFIIVLFGILAVMWFGEVPMKAVGGVIAAVAVIGVLAILFVGFRSDRLSAWLDPWEDPLGNGYQIINSFYAFSDGGIFGVGLGNSLQKYLYLPEAYNDFIFAIIGEELGLIGCTAVIALFVVLLYASIKIGQHAADDFGAVLAPACGALLTFQALLNICCVVGIFPITGKPMPFVSYGGTSLVTSLMLVGLILSVSLHAESPSAEKRRDALVIADGGRKRPASSEKDGADGGRKRLASSTKDGTDGGKSSRGSSARSGRAQRERNGSSAESRSSSTSRGARAEKKPAGSSADAPNTRKARAAKDRQDADEAAARRRERRERREREERAQAREEKASEAHPEKPKRKRTDSERARRSGRDKDRGKER